MTKKYMKHIDECGMYYYICNGEEIIAEVFYGDDAQDIVNLLNEQDERIRELEKEKESLKETIIKITTAYQKKYNNTIVNLIEESVKNGDIE